MSSDTVTISFDNTFANQMEGFYVDWKAARVPKPEIIIFNHALSQELGLDAQQLNSETGAQILSGNTLAEGSKPIAQVYAGHQFGGFSPQLGDGRALMLGEVIDVQGHRRDIQLKGSGPTPFSRQGDGKAVLGPVLREYLMGEAMHALGIATTRSLAALATGEQIVRNGIEPGAILVRVAASHLRVGTFQFFAARGDHERLKKLADYSISRHDRALENAENKYLEFLKSVMKRQAQLIAKWVSIGFIHGVMNTDNMTISGETIDYGPCAFMDIYNPRTVFSSIDDHGRYAYGNQPVIAQWNLARFAETLVPLINPDDADEAIKMASDVLNAFPQLYQSCWLDEMRRKLSMLGEEPGDIELVNELHQIIDGEKVDYTKLFRQLAQSLREGNATVLALVEDKSAFQAWLEAWEKRITQSGLNKQDAAEAMDKVNPVYIPRNHLVEEALTAAAKDNDLQPFKTLLEVLQSPFEKRQGYEAYEDGADENAKPHITFCGT